MTQLSLLAGVERVERPWKVVRQVSRQVYAELRRSGRVARRTQQVITALAYFRNRTQSWPTAAELAAFMHQHGRLPRPDSRLVAPRLTELLRGRVDRLKDGTRVRRGGGLLVLQPVRRCAVSGESAHPVAIREAGSRTHQVA